MGIEHTTETSNWLWTGGHYGDSPRSNTRKDKPPQLKMDFAKKQISIKDTVVSARGAKSNQIRDENNAKIFTVLGSSEEPLTTPFGASSYGGEETARKTLELTLNEAHEEAWRGFDLFMVDYIAQHSFRLCKRILTVDQVKDMWKSPMTKKGDYRAHLRTKVTTSGSHQVRVWNEHREKIPLPDDLREVEICHAKIHVSHLWQMSKEIGVVLVCTDLMIRSASSECPFENGSFGGA